MSVPDPAAAGPVAFMGDSITFAWSELSSRPGLLNLGVPIETTAEMLARLPRQLGESGARGLHILGGINDIAGNGGPVPLEATCANLAAMARLGRKRGLRVWLGAVLPVDGLWWNPALADAPEQVIELNRRLREATAHLGVAYLDYHSRLADGAGRLRPAFGTDGVHLSPAGYAEITPLAFAAIDA